MPFSFPEKIDVHKYEEKIKGQELLLEQAAIPEGNKQLIKDFIAFCKADPKVGGSRVRLYLYTLRNIALWTGNKNFKEMEKKDIAELIAKLKAHKFVPKKRLNQFNIECRERSVGEEERIRLLAELTEKEGRFYSSNTIEDYLKTIKKFWKWLYDTDDEDPPQTRWLRTRANRTDEEPQVFTKVEIKKLIDGCNSPRDKAFFSCLYDLDCRVSELLTRQIKHLKYDEDGDIQILIESEKTRKKHWEVLFESAPLLATWLRMHPSPSEPDAPLWTNTRRNGRIDNLTYPNARKIFMTICRNQQIRPGRRNIIHMLRKSKATHDIMDGVPLSVIESRGSWSKGSRALHQCYISIQDEDKKNAYRKKYGMPSLNGHKDEPVELQRCDRCHAILESNSKFCANCGFCIDKMMREMSKRANEEVATLVDEKMLSEMVKKIVTEALQNANHGKN